MYASICSALILWLCAVPIAYAQQAASDPEPCRDDESAENCFSRVTSASPPDLTPEIMEKVQKENVDRELEVAQTGADTEGTATASTLSDLAQFLNALGLLSTGDAAGSKIALDLNFLLPVQDVSTHNAQLQAIVETEPEPLDQLVQSFGETVREARKDSLQKDIPTFGDVQLSFTWSLVNSRFGRDYSTLRSGIARLNEGVASRGRNAVSRDALRAFAGVVARRNVAVTNGNEVRAASGKPAIPLTAGTGQLPIDDELKSELKSVAFKAGRERALITEGIQNELNRSGIGQLAKLVEQQPQLLFSLTHNFRNELVGPDSSAATVTWEMTTRNLGSFLRNEGRSCTNADVSSGARTYDSCVDALQKYVAAVPLDRQMRYKLEASYKRVKSVTYSYADDNVNFLIPEHDRWEVAFAMGRPLSTGMQAARVDFELSYDSNIDSDVSNEERLQASLTYTRRVGDMDMPFSIVYANKDEFLGEVDHRLSLNLGLKFRQK